MDVVFYTITNLQGSQTISLSYKLFKSFAPLQTYKVLKPLFPSTHPYFGFAPLQTYKVLKPLFPSTHPYFGFAPLQTYKVLKRKGFIFKNDLSFAPLQTYKVLKQVVEPTVKRKVLHHYKLTRFSNVNCSFVRLI